MDQKSKIEWKLGYLVGSHGLFEVYGDFPTMVMMQVLSVGFL